jgi:phosphoglycerate dehydrogenase-like enzyme
VGETILLSDHVWERRQDDIRAVAPDVTAVLYVGAEPVPAAQLEPVTIGLLSGDVWPDRVVGLSVSLLKSPTMRWLQSFSAGVDNPFFAQILERGVRLTTASGTSASPIAQTVVMYMLALSRNLRGWMRNQDRKEWTMHPIEELDGSSLAVIGMGPIGEHVARLGVALGMRVEAVRRTPAGTEPCPTFPMAHLHAVLNRADWVVVALPHTPDTRGLFDANAFAAMRPGVRFINVGRGELVDETALTSALQSGHLGGAGLDVFATEPLPTESPLWSMDNVIITPHNSGWSTRADERAEDLFIDNLGRYLRGEPLINEVAAQAQ